MTERDAGQLSFGDIPPQEAALQRRERRKRSEPIENLEVYNVYRLGTLIEEAVIEDASAFRERRSEWHASAERVLQKVWGEGVSLPRYVHPSTAAKCLKWVGYEALADELGVKPAPRPFKAEMGMRLGSGGHHQLSMVLRKYGIPEATLINDEYGISGRLDFMIRNPVTSEYQVLDFKFPGDWAYRQVKRDGLPDYLKQTKGIYNPRPEDRLQLLLYMKGRREEGFNVSVGNIVYFNRDTLEYKECIIPWNADAENHMEDFLANITKAREAIKRGELPEPTVGSTYICASMCDYRLHCDYGQQFAAGKIKREAKRRDPGVWKMVEQQEEEKAQQLIDLGILQPPLLMELGEDEGNPSSSKAVASGESNKEEQKRKETVYKLGVAEKLEGVKCFGYGCGEDVSRYCTKVGDRRGNKVRIEIEITCPHDGLLDTRQKTVKKSQVIESVETS